jgi:hypothetical protein
MLMLERGGSAFLLKREEDFSFHCWEVGNISNKPVMAILADHLLVPSNTDCFTAFMCPM